MGEQVAKDMVAVRVGPDVRMAVVAAPAYFEKRSPPKSPQDLLAHQCINLRLPTYGGLYAWEFEKASREVRVRVEGKLVFSEPAHILKAALAGFGLAYLLEDWCPPFSGYHLYYPSRRQALPAFAVVIEALRYRA
jgi:DNA-binding transcriptional LysR family regulator